MPLRSIRRNLLSRNATANAFSATFNRSVLNEGQLNNIRVVSIGANGAPIANAEAHATVMCEVPAGHVTITSPSQGATIE